MRVDRLFKPYLRGRLVLPDRQYFLRALNLTTITPLSCYGMKVSHTIVIAILQKIFGFTCLNGPHLLPTTAGKIGCLVEGFLGLLKKIEPREPDLNRNELLLTFICLLLV